MSADAIAAIQRALESAGVEFIAENGSGPGVRLKRVERHIRMAAYDGGPGMIVLGDPPDDAENAGPLICMVQVTPELATLIKKKGGYLAYAISGNIDRDTVLDIDDRVHSSSS